MAKVCRPASTPPGGSPARIAKWGFSDQLQTPEASQATAGWLAAAMEGTRPKAGEKVPAKKAEAWPMPFP